MAEPRVSTPQIVGFGGYGDSPEQTLPLLRYALSLTEREEPRVMLVPTATAEDETRIELTSGLFSGLAELTVLRFFPWPPDGLRELVLAQDAICVGGGNTANMLAIWRVHGFDTLLREAWENGVVLFGASAGMICWFEAGVTDSFGPQLEGMRDGLGFVAGSACPHYDGEPLRRPRYRELVDGGFPEGIAADDGVGVHFVGASVHRVVSCRPGATAYRVGSAGEEPLDAVLLD